MTALDLHLAASPAADAAASAVRTLGLGKWIDERAILRDIELEIPAGGYVALLGPNGAGKSTLLRVLSTLTAPTQGALYLLGRQVDRRAAATLRARIGMIGHQPMLYGDLSAEENLVFFGRLYGVVHPSRRAAELLERVGLTERARDAAKTFSRGMTQRLAIARALMHEPDLILADEPFSGLDLPSSAKLEELLAGLHRAGKTIVLVNHDPAQSLRLAQRVVVLRRGRIVGDHVSDKTALETLVTELTV